MTNLLLIYWQDIHSAYAGI